MRCLVKTCQWLCTHLPYTHFPMFKYGRYFYMFCDGRTVDGGNPIITLAYCAELLDPASNDSSISGDSSIGNFWEHPKDCKKWTPTQVRKNLKRWTGLNKVKLCSMLIRIGPHCDVVRGDSEYGTPVAIREMLHNSCFEWWVLIVFSIGIHSIWYLY
jgi:hypothetical protein